jgi:uncharacterized membrane protein (UPF0182 family)
VSARPVAPVFPIVAFLQRRSRTQRWIAAGVVAVLGVVWLVRFAAATLLDKWWFDSVTSAPVWSTRLTAQIELAVGAAVISGLVLGVSAYLGLTVGPAPDNGPNRIVVRYRQRMGPAHRWILIGIAVLLTLQAIPAAMNRWQPWVLFLNGPNLGQRAPEIGFDLGYHLFRLPFLIYLGSWLRRLLILAGVIAIAGHIANGALRLPGRGRRSARRALAHLGLLAAGLAVVQGLIYLLVQRPSLATNQSGAFDGPGFTELRVLSPVLIILAIVAFGTAVAAVYGVRFANWRPTRFAIAIWAGVYVLGMWVAPYVVQKVIVKPAEAERELPYIAHNLEATRTAYRLDTVEQVLVPYTDGLEAPLSDEARTLVDRTPVFMTDQLANPLQVLEGTTATRITDVDLDRYTIDGVTRPVFIAARNANRSDLPEKGWVQMHLVYTHGNGIVAVPADTVASDGRPNVDELAITLAPERPELYFGEGLGGWYAIVGTKRTEQGGARFDAATGIQLGGLWERLVTAIGLGDIEPLTSSELTSSSQLLYRRDLRERLRMLAPFVSWDAEAYPVVTGDRVVWIMDGYTRASTYPYAQFARQVGLSGASSLAIGVFNYLHGSVKATVDAYDGTVHLYRTAVGGADDPILEAWELVFPGLLEPISNMPADLATHLLYPPDLLQVQTALLGRYHVTDPELLFSGSARWSVTPAPGNGVAQDSPGQSPAVSLFLPSSGDMQGHWVAIRPYGPGASSNPAANRDVLAAIAIADHDDPERMVLVEMKQRPGRQVSSPLVAQSAIDTDPDLARSFTLLNANGSAVQFGPMTPLPLDGAMVWARPIVVTGTAGTTAPRLFGVAAVSNGLVGEAATTSQAVTEAAAAGS